MKIMKKKKTFTENLTKEEISEKLEDYTKESEPVDLYTD